MKVEGKSSQLSDKKRCSRLLADDDDKQNRVCVFLLSGNGKGNIHCSFF